ncbi:ribokinase [Shouchella patagoniensis]|uniref:ribokinase n=1 Tax=Shouchella patagoniensis TaxID=228576 RepID=UPI000995044C|nr:ribokinase [Shouchella patagoniensis]
MEFPQVVVVGSLNYDLVLKQDRLPYKGETYTADDLIQGPGGKGANQAVQCAKLGLSTAMIGKVGEDRFGEALLGTLRAVGINDEGVKRQGTTGLGVVHLLPDGDYYSTLLKGANHLLTESDIDEQKNFIQNCEFLLLQQEVPDHVVEYVIDIAESSNCQIVLNNAPARSIKEDSLKKVDILVVNETEAAYMENASVDSIDEAKVAASNLLKRVQKAVILTLGEKGAIVAQGTSVIHVPAKKVTAVDATGAGDSYIGALVFSLNEGKSYEEAAIFASEISAKTVSQYGGSDSFPTHNTMV